MSRNIVSGGWIATAALVSGLVGACAAQTPQQVAPVAAAPHVTSSSGAVAQAPPTRTGQPLCESLPVFFANDSAQLDASGRARLGELSACLRGQPIGALVVTARADPRGTASDNELLSAQRAETVARFLREQGYTNVRLTTRSEGENDMPDDPARYPYERRATVYVRRVNP